MKGARFRDMHEERVRERETEMREKRDETEERR
jgi:hypothetical protein